MKTTIKTALYRLALGTVAIISLGLLWLYLQHGRGLAYPSTLTEPLRPAQALERVISLDFPPGNVAVSQNGRVFFNYHPFAKAERFTSASVFEWRDGQAVPYPSAEFQARYQGVFGMTVDRQNRLWLVEPRGLDHAQTRLLAFDLAQNRLVFEHWFGPDQAQFTQDLRVSADGNTVFLADTGLFRFTPASLLVLNVATKQHHLALQNDASAQAQNWLTKRFDGANHALGFGLVGFVVGLDGIELSADGQWLYYAAMSHDSVFRIPTAALIDPGLSDAKRSSSIERVGSKPLSDGITLDANGNVLITDIEHGAIARLAPNGELRTLVRDPKIVWSDGIALAPDGNVWLTDSSIPSYIHPLALPPNLKNLQASKPYGIYRLKPN